MHPTAQFEIRGEPASELRSCLVMLSFGPGLLHVYELSSSLDDVKALIAATAYRARSFPLTNYTAYRSPIFGPQDKTRSSGKPSLPMQELRVH